MNIKIKDARDFFVDEKEKINRVYVCSPLSASTDAGIARNMMLARDKCNVLNGMFRGTDIKAWAPHAWLPKMLDDNVPSEREAAIAFGTRLLEMSDVMYVFGPKLSKGMKSEITYGIKHGLTIICEEDIKPFVLKFIKGMEETQ